MASFFLSLIIFAASILILFKILDHGSVFEMLSKSRINIVFVLLGYIGIQCHFAANALRFYFCIRLLIEPI